MSAKNGGDSRGRAAPWDSRGSPTPSASRRLRAPTGPGALGLPWVRPGPGRRWGGGLRGRRSGDPAHHPGPYSHLTDQLLPEGGTPPICLLPRNVHAGPPAPTSRVPLGRRRRLNRSARPKPGSRPQRVGRAGSGAGIVGNGVARAGLWEMEFPNYAPGVLGAPRLPQATCTSLSAALTRVGYTRCPELTRKDAGEPWLRSATIAAPSRPAPGLLYFLRSYCVCWPHQVQEGCSCQLSTADARQIVC